MSEAQEKIQYFRTILLKVNRIDPTLINGNATSFPRIF